MLAALTIVTTLVAGACPDGTSPAKAANGATACERPGGQLHGPYREAGGKFGGDYCYGQRHGWWTVGYSGRLSRSGLYVNGAKSGCWTSFGDGGVREREECYLPDGRSYETRWVAGVVVERAWYRFGMRDGYSETYGTDGKVLTKTTWRRGHKHGLELQWHPDGRFRVEFCWTDGDAGGKWHDEERKSPGSDCATMGIPRKLPPSPSPKPPAPPDRPAPCEAPQVVTQADGVTDADFAAATLPGQRAHKPLRMAIGPKTPSKHLVYTTRAGDDVRVHVLLAESDNGRHTVLHLGSVQGDARWHRVTKIPAILPCLGRALCVLYDDASGRHHTGVFAWSRDAGSFVHRPGASGALDDVPVTRSHSAATVARSFDHLGAVKRRSGWDPKAADVRQVVFAPKGRRAALVTPTEVRLWTPGRPKQITLKHANAQVAFPSRRRVAVVTAGSVAVYDARSGKPAGATATHAAAPTAAFGHRGVVGWGDATGAVHRLDVETGKAKPVIKVAGPVSALSFDRRYVAVSFRDPRTGKTAHVLYTAAGKRVRSFGEDRERVVVVPGADLLVVDSWTETARDGRALGSIAAEENGDDWTGSAPEALAVSPNGRYVATIGAFGYREGDWGVMCVSHTSTRRAATECATWSEIEDDPSDSRGEVFEADAMAVSANGKVLLLLHEGKIAVWTVR